MNAGGELAVLLSVATRIEPELVRAVRLLAAPRLDVAAEHDLWFGDLVGRRGHGFVMLRPEVLPGLRATLGDRLRAAPPGAPLTRLRDTVLRCHAGLSPALAAEEEAVWESVRDDRPGAEERIEQALRPALRALVDERRDGIARWLSGAWERLPERVRRTTTVWQLATVAAARQLPGVSVPAPPAPARLPLSAVVPLAPHLPTVWLYLRREGSRLRLFDTGARPGDLALEVPDTDPRVLSLDAGQGGGTVLVGRGDTAVREVGLGPVRIVTGSGAVFELDAVTPAAPARTRGDRHVVISHTGYSRPWATWIAHQLELRGCGTTLHRWELDADADIAGQLRRLRNAPDLVLLVLDDWNAVPTPARSQRWQEALRELSGTADMDRFTAVSVSTRAVAPVLAALIPVDLQYLDEAEAIRRVCRRLSVAEEPDHDARTGGGPRFPNDPPDVWSVARRNGRFTGREAVLDELRERLLDTDSSPWVVLLGTSGVGKSQIAVEYAHRYGNDYDVVWWIASDSRATAREQLAALAPALELRTGQTIGERIRAVHEALRTGHPYRRWLLIFDGADDESQQADLLPPGGHVLITSQTRDWSHHHGCHEIAVHPFTRSESIAYVVRQAPRVTPEEAGELAEAVQDLPLLLAQTAAWLDTNPMDVRAYVREISQGSPEQIAIRISADYPMAFLASWRLALNALREKDPMASELLKLLAFFSPYEIPLDLLAGPRSGVLPPELEQLVADQVGWHRALVSLSESSAVRLGSPAEESRDGRVDHAQMHRIYHRFLRLGMSDDERDLLSGVACRVLVDADPRRPTDSRDWPAYTRLLPHLEPSGALGSRDPGAQELVRNCVEYLRVRGEYRTGLRLCEQALAQLRGRVPPTDPTVLVLEHQHANMLRRSGRYREAEAVGRRVVELLGETGDTSSAELLRANDGLGGTLLALGDYQRAHVLFEQGWQAYRELFGDEAPRTLASRSNLGLALGLLGRYEEALHVHREVLLVRERRLRARHTLTLGSGASYAQMSRLLGRYGDAASRLEQIARLRRQIADEHSPESILVHHQLGICRRLLGDLRPADDLLRATVAQARQVHGPGHPETLLMEANLAMFLREYGELAAAHDLAVRVHGQYLGLLGPHHPYTAGTLGNLGLVLAAMGDVAGTLRGAEEAHTTMAEAVGPGHPWTVGCAINLTAARHWADDHEGALALSRVTQVRAEEALGGWHPVALSARAALADDLRAMRRAEEAARHEREAVQRLGETLGPEHPHTIAVLRRVRPTCDFEPSPI
ncbi:FxSxx-COOH system tetratricopeptide repeat protein [Streptomyces sp. NPDC051940]|uniref:FxSxx-COOH system tetratricopeptide repeat protein n=1 Tax=Streptomyces sp. NPDC051940 TaxID=3155675 RepID=UPI00342F0EEC